MSNNADMDIIAVIDMAGGVGKLATLLGVKHPTVCDWKRSGFVPGGRVVQISRAMQIPLSDLSGLVRTPARKEAA